MGKDVFVSPGEAPEIKHAVLRGYVLRWTSTGPSSLPACKRRGPIAVPPQLQRAVPPWPENASIARSYPSRRESSRRRWSCSPPSISPRT